MKVLLILAENSWKTEIKPFLFCAHELVANISELLFLETFFFWFQLVPDPFKLNCFSIFGNPKAFHTVLT